ncbi:MAG: putative metalloprotease CJM1_0395 family protein [Pseudomonadota bacterium]
MLIGSAMPYAAPAPSAMPARPLSPDVSQDLLRANQAPVAATQAQADPDGASAREEADRPASEVADKALGPRAEQAAQQRQEQQVISDLASRDRKVRIHEQAHAAVGGAYAGAPTYTFKRGPDGKSYAVGGEVSIDASPVPNDPAATLRKMEVVLRAALAPAEPSAQDLRVASQAQGQASQARADLAQQQREATQAQAAERAESGENREEDDPEQAADESQPGTPRQTRSSVAALELYQGLTESAAPAPQVNLVA